MLFFLSVDREGRVILDTVAHGKKLRAIRAKPKVSGRHIVCSAWQVARDKMPWYAFSHVHGHGYFLYDRNGVRTCLY